MKKESAEWRDSGGCGAQSGVLVRTSKRAQATHPPPRNRLSLPITSQSKLWNQIPEFALRVLSRRRQS